MRPFLWPCGMDLRGELAVRRVGAICVGLLLTTSTSLAATPPPDTLAAKQEAQKLARLPPVTPRGAVDHSGRKQTGRASYYARSFTNRKMADGNRFNPNGDVAASKTLPLGTTAKVTNLRNGKSVMVTVEDRGPLTRGRVVDITPKAAEQLDIRKQGVEPVIVAPIAVPQPDGAVKLGAGAAEASEQEVAWATLETASSAKSSR